MTDKKNNEKQVKSNSLTVKTGVKAGGMGWKNHNEKIANDNSLSIEQKKTFGRKLQLREETIRELKIKTGVKAGAINPSGNHNEKQVKSKSLTIKTGVKAGAPVIQHNEKIGTHPLIL